MEVLVHLDVVVSYDASPRPRVSVFPAFDEVLLVEPASEIQKVCPLPLLIITFFSGREVLYLISFSNS